MGQELSAHPIWTNLKMGQAFVGILKTWLGLGLKMLPGLKLGWSLIQPKPKPKTNQDSAPDNPTQA